MSRRRIGPRVSSQITAGGMTAKTAVPFTPPAHATASDKAAGSWIAMLLAVAGIHLAMLYAGLALSRLLAIPREDRIAVAFSGSQKTLMVGLHIALGPPFNNGLAMLPLVAYHVCQLLLDTVVANRLKAAAAPTRETDNRYSSGSPMARR